VYNKPFKSEGLGKPPENGCILGSVMGPAEYNNFVSLYWSGRMNLNQLIAIYDKEFAGILPDWVQYELAIHKHHKHFKDVNEIYRERYSLPCTNIHFGTVYFDKDHIVKGKGYGTPDGFELWMVKDIKKSIMHDDNLPDQIKKYLRLAYPSTAESLRQRERFDVGTLLHCVLPKLEQAGVKRIEIWDLLNSLRGCGSSMTCNMIMAYSISTVLRRVIKAMIKRRFFRSGIFWYVRLTKAIHDRIRASGSGWCPLLDTTNDDDYRVLLYLQNLAGRFVIPGYSASEEVELRKSFGREKFSLTQAQSWSKTDFDEVVSKRLHAASVSYAHGFENVSHMKMREVVTNWQQIGTVGAASAMRKIKITLPDGSEEKLFMPSKTVWLMSKTADELAEILKTEPKIRGVAIDKYEPSKLRLLLPSDVEHWFIESMALTFGERPVARASEASQLELNAAETLAEHTARLAAIARQDVMVASDYKDFNILHEFKTMSKMWLTLAKRLDPTGMRYFGADADSSIVDFAACCCRWAAAALGDVYTRRPDRKVNERLVRGLWSGWRSTTFINTLFNEAYSDVLRQTFKNKWGYDPVKVMHVLGDDGEAIFSDEYSGLRFLQLLDHIGLDAQASKQLISTRRTEFLRLFYENGQVRGALCRTIASSLSGDMQSNACKTGPDAAYAFNETLHTYIRRGADKSFVEAIRYSLLMPIAHATWWEKKKRVIVRPSLNTLRASVASGGLGCTRYGEQSVEFVNKFEMMPSVSRAPMEVVKCVEKQIPLNLVRSFTSDKLLRSKFQMLWRDYQIPAHRVLGEVKRAIYEPYLPSSVQLKMRSAYMVRVGEAYRLRASAAIRYTNIDDEIVFEILDILNDTADAAQNNRTIGESDDILSIPKNLISMALGALAPAQTELISQIKTESPVNVVTGLQKMIQKNLAPHINDALCGS